MTQHKVQYDVFISYRRSDGFATARLIYDRLIQQGYRVSFDLETLRSGNFNTQLYERIENCRDVIVIVSADALKFRDVPEHDWLRLEIAHAMKLQKNIIPVFLRGVEIPPREDMPEDIAELVMKNGITASEEHFDSALKKLCRLMHSRRKIKHKILFSVAALLVLALCGTGYYFYKNPVYPLTHSEKQEFSLIFTYLIQQMENVNLTAYYYKQLLQAAQNAVLTGEMSDFKDEQSRFDNHLKNMKQVQFAPEFIGMAQRSRVIDAGDLKFFPQIYDNYMDFVTKKILHIAHTIAPQNLTGKSDKLRILEINRKFADILADSVEISFIALLYKVRSSDVDDFKKLTAPQLTNLPLLTAPWPTEAGDLVNLINKGNEQAKLLLQEEAAILGKLSQEKNAELHQLRKQLKKQGLTDAQIDKLLQQNKDVSRIKAELIEMVNRLKVAKLKALKKFAPVATDDDSTLWGKMVALQKAYLPEEALKALTMIGQNKAKTISEKVCQVVRRILLSPHDLPFSHGVIVVFFEPPATSHAIFQLGDIVTQVNNKDCYSSDTFRTAEGMTYTIFRMNKSGKFEKLTLTMPGKQPRTAIASLPLQEKKL